MKNNKTMELTTMGANGCGFQEGGDASTQEKCLGRHQTLWLEKKTKSVLLRSVNHHPQQSGKKDFMCQSKLLLSFSSIWDHFLNFSNDTPNDDVN